MLNRRIPPPRSKPKESDKEQAADVLQCPGGPSRGVVLIRWHRWQRGISTVPPSSTVPVPVYLDEEDYTAHCVLELKGEISFRIIMKPRKYMAEMGHIRYDLSRVTS